MKEDQKINLICRMAGNIFTGGHSGVEDATDLALRIFEEVEKRVKEEGEGENE